MLYVYSMCVMCFMWLDLSPLTIVVLLEVWLRFGKECHCIKMLNVIVVSCSTPNHQQQRKDQNDNPIHI